MGKKISIVYNAGILTVSDNEEQSKPVDASGNHIKRVLEKEHYNIARYQIVPHDINQISQTMSNWADTGAVDFIITTGGTGINPGDVTPEATLSVIHRLLPGIAELMRIHGYKKNTGAILSRAVAGCRGQCLIINLPGNLEAVKDYLPLILPLIPHSVDTLKGRISDRHH